MKRLLAFLAPFFLSGLVPASAATSPTDTRVYELRTYTAVPGKFDAVLARFRDHVLALFTKHGMVNYGYWVPTDAKDGAGEKLIYLLAHANRAAADASWKAFLSDPAWQKVKAESEAGGRIVSKIESVFLTTADFSPSVSPRAYGTPRIFEMRAYYAVEGKMAALDDRFRQHTRAFFTKHGIQNIAYFHPVSPEQGAGSTLIYFLAYPSREAATASWAAFQSDPAWVAVKTATERPGPLRTHADSVFLRPTDFSPTQ